MTRNMEASTARAVLLLLVGLGLFFLPGCKPKERSCEPCPRFKEIQKKKPAKIAQRKAPKRLGRLLASLPEAKAPVLNADLATRLSALSIRCVDKEYPNKPGDVQTDDRSARQPRKLHPAFFGCFDWHSAVHGHWAMVRVLSLFPSLPQAPLIRSTLDRHLTAGKLSGELDYFMAKHNTLFERPYGWGWFLRLALEIHEMRGHGQDEHFASRWAKAVLPLEQLIARRIIDYLKLLSVPLRAGTHHSTAFALAHAHDYARWKKNKELLASINAASRRFYLGDRHCPTDYEPSGEDFISPCLAEADLMRRVLDPARFIRWLDGFLPDPASPRFAPLLRLPEVRDKKDAKIVHLIGLGFHRAWTMKGIASVLPPSDPRVGIFRRLASSHAKESLELMFGSGYGGTHWLSSFAIFALTDVGLARRKDR